MLPNLRLSTRKGMETIWFCSVTSMAADSGAGKQSASSGQQPDWH